MNNQNLFFNYLNLVETLNRFYKFDIDTVNVTLLVSLEREYYEGKNMKLIMSDLKHLFKNKEIICEINSKTEKFKINRLSLQVGDVLNRHMLYYRHCAQYFDEHNINDENLIPLEIREYFEKISYEEGKQEGKEWFKNNLKAFNLFSDEKVLTKDVYIGDDITEIFAETEDTPALDYICYEHWLSKEKRYKEIKEGILELCNINNSIISGCYDYEIECFLKRLERRNEAPKYTDLFIKQSLKYLIDETIPPTIENARKNNYFEIYYGGFLDQHIKVYNGRRALNNKVIRSYVRGKLNGIDKNTYITIKSKNDLYQYK